MSAKEKSGQLFFPKAAVNGFAGDAAYQRAETLAKEIEGVIVSSENDIRGVRPSFWVYKDYADVPASKHGSVEEDFTPDEPLSIYGFTEIDLPGVGKVQARAVGADENWRGYICNSPFRAEIRIVGNNWINRYEGDVIYGIFQACDGYELNWYSIPESEREKLIEATSGIKAKFFSKSGLGRMIVR